MLCCPQPHVKRHPSVGYCSSFGRARDSLSLKPSRSPETSELIYRFTHAEGRFVQLKRTLTLLMFCAKSSAQGGGNSLVSHRCYSFLPSACSTTRLLQLEEIFVVVFSLLFTLRYPYILPLNCHPSTQHLTAQHTARERQCD